MKKNRWFLRMIALLLLSGLLSVMVTAASGVGTEDDPLITLSYLNDTFLGEILEKVDAKIESRNDQLAEELAGAGDSDTANTFTVVTLSSGQVLTGDIGCEVMLRVGTAVCVSESSPGLIDQTDASVLNNDGALTQNHLYLMTIEDRGVKATAATTKLLVRGEYSIT